LRMVSDETTSKFVWLYSASSEAALLSPFLVEPDKYWGYVRTSGSSIYVGFRCKEGIELSLELVAAVKFVSRDGRMFSEWKVNTSVLTELVSVLSLQQDNSDSSYRIPSGLFETWMARLIFQYGYIVYELCVHLQSTSISVDDLSTVLNVTQYRVNRMIRDVVRPEGVLVLNDGEIQLGDVYRDKTERWIAQQQVVQAQIWETLSTVEETLTMAFPLAEGWIVAMPTTLRLWNSIAVYREEWKYGIHHERKLAIDVFIDRPYINRINAIGISGRFVGANHLKIRDELLKNQSGGLCILRRRASPIFYSIQAVLSGLVIRKKNKLSLRINSSSGWRTLQLLQGILPKPYSKKMPCCVQIGKRSNRNGIKNLHMRVWLVLNIS